MAEQIESDSYEPDIKRARKEGDAEATNSNVLEFNSETDSSEKPACESDVGITEYISTHKGFTAILKQRYSDFLVNEVSEDGYIVRLNDIDSPKVDSEGEKTELKNPKLLEVISDDEVQELRTIESMQTGEVWIQVGDDKEKRTSIHQIIRENFNNLESSTTEKDGQKYIKICSANVKNNFNKHKRDHHKRKPAWPKGKPEYCHFVLYKENNDTPNAINQIAKVLRVNAGQFTYAGTKDKRSKSSQHITVHRITATRLHHLNNRFKYFALGNFKYVDRPLKLGMLKGNHFTVILRNVTGSDDQVNQGVTTLREIGFINYFGMQRFGTASVPTHHIGRAILQNKWTDVVDLIMQPRNDGISKARLVWKETQDAKAALDVLGSRPCIEKHLLMGIAKSSKKDIVGALSFIPRNSRHMYLHSYQSYIWNNMVSIRIKKHGLQPIIGDLVIIEKDNVEEDEEEECKRAKPVILTKENINSYTIRDVVLPLPGFDITLPSNDIKEEYEALMLKDEINLQSFKHKVRDYAMPGGYRNILVKPENLKCEISSYSDYTVPLVLSDYDKLKGETLTKNVEDGQYKAVMLEFTLPRSTYATMAIREVLKCDTSANYQTKLNTT